MALALAQTLLRCDVGSHVALQMNVHSELDSLNYQSDFMKTTFNKLPTAVLFHRTHNSKGKALYTFIVDDLSVKVDIDIIRVIHFAIPKNELSDGLTHMYTTFKKLNPNWPKIKIMLVDPHFRGTAALAEAFPTVTIVLSVFHVCKHIQQKISQMGQGNTIEKWLLKALNGTMSSARGCSLRYMHDTIKRNVKPELFRQLHSHWLLTNQICVLHRWMNRSLYFQCLEAITQDLNQIFTSGLSLESSIASLATHIRDCSVNVKSPDPVHEVEILCLPGNPPLYSSGHGSVQEEPKVTSGSDPSPSFGSLHAKNMLQPEDHKKATGSATLEAQDQIQQSLALLCTEPAAKLCLNELAVAEQSGTTLGTSDDNMVNVQIIEDPHVVSGDSPKICTCHFNKTSQLPCRHIMAALRGDHKVLQLGMVHEKWYKTKYYDDDLLEVLKSSWLTSKEKAFNIKFLTDDLMRMLADCSNEEFEHRYNMLRDLADNWIGPYEQVKL